MQSDFYIGRWRIHPQLNRISGLDETIQVEPKIMQVLVYLAEHSGRVVSRDRLLETVWSDVVVGEEVVSRSISELRKAFGDNPKSPTVIETIPKAGYRLIAPISLDETSGDHVPEPILSVGAQEIDLSRKSKRVSNWRYGVLGVVLVVMGMGAWMRLGNQPASEPTFIARTTPLTSFRDFEFAPALSPDGRQAAFIWTGGEKNGRLNVYVKLVNSGEPLQLTNSRLYEWSPTWSPDGSQIAFARSIRGIYTVPALGGPERKLASIHRDSRPDIDWSPTGDFIAFTDRDSSQAPYRIHLLSVENGAVQPLTQPTALLHGDRSPSFSPDGRLIAFSRVSDNAGDLYVVPVEGGEPRRLTHDHVNIDGLSWTPDGKHILFSSNRGGPYGLWKVSLAGDQLEPVSLSGAGDLIEPALRDRTLAYTQSFMDVNLWRRDLKDTTAEASMAPFSSSRWDADPQYAPDNRRVAFASSRSGHTEIWVSDRSGTTTLQLTEFGGPHTAHPRWSPDSEHIAFDTREAGNADIHLVEARGGASSQLTTALASDILPSWSSDGAWVYFASNRSGTWQVWKKPAAGGEATRVTQRGGYAAFEAPDGLYLYYTRRDTPGLWRTSTNGGAETRIIDFLAVEDWGQWGIAEDGIYYVHTAGRSRSIHFYSFASETSSWVSRLTNDPIWNRTGFTVDRKGSELLIAQTDESHLDILVTEFRP